MKQKKASADSDANLPNGWREDPRHAACLHEREPDGKRAKPTTVLRSIKRFDVRFWGKADMFHPPELGNAAALAFMNYRSRAQEIDSGQLVGVMVFFVRVGVEASHSGAYEA